MEFGARLEAIGRMVGMGSSIVDVGTDHAYLPLLLWQQGKLKYAIAADIADGPCCAARSTVEQFGCGGVVEVRQGDGLTIVRPEEVDIIVIAGMGGGTILNILQGAPAVTAAAQRLVLQPMNAGEKLRRTLLTDGWHLVAEVLAAEGGRLYEIMALEKGCGEAFPAWQYEVGPLLIKGKSVLLQAHMEQLLHKYEQLLKNMSKSTMAQNSERYHALAARKKELEVFYHANYR